MTLKPADASSSEIPVGRNRLEGKVALMFGAGSVGEGWGNGNDITGVCLPVDGGLACKAA